MCAFELSAVLDMVALRQFHIVLNLLADLVHRTLEVTVGDIGGNDNLAGDILAIDGVRAGC